ncbi:MAG: DNA methyltransferase [Candidatus Thorarchaeota archaeon]
MKKYNPIKQVVHNINLKEWTVSPYSIQSWGSWLHRISPYVGRIKPSFAHFLIKYISNKDDIILDLFCGIGTIPTEAALMGRRSVGVDLNPYAYYIAKAKSDNKRDLKDILKYLNTVKIDTKGIRLEETPEWVKEYYNANTLKEILFLINKLKADKQYFILGCLIGISQGHRPGHLSKPCAWTLPFKPKKDDKGEYREVKPRLIEKIKRTYQSNFEEMKEMQIYLADARKLPLQNNSVDHVISSPPYFDTLDYVNSHRLRLAVIGFYNTDKNKLLKQNLIQRFDTYLEEMEICIKEINRVIKKSGYCIFILGDCFKRGAIINTAEQLKPICEKYGFTSHAIIQDKIPINKSVQKRTKTQKHDRIMILTKN